MKYIPSQNHIQLQIAVPEVLFTEVSLVDFVHSLPKIMANNCIIIKIYIIKSTITLLYHINIHNNIVV